MAWMPQHGSVGNYLKIGYGTKQKVNDIGLLESEAFNYWIEDFKVKERKLKGIIGNIASIKHSMMPVSYILTQVVYTA